MAAIAHDPFAKFTNEELMEGLARLFRVMDTKTCRKCGNVQKHATCDRCRSDARADLDRTRRARAQAARPR